MKKIIDFMFLLIFRVFIKTIQLLNCDMKDSEYSITTYLFIY